MEFTCEHCNKVFNTNAGLYTHKETYHKAPAVVLVNHNQHNPSTSFDRPTSPTNIPLNDDTSSEMSFENMQPNRKRKVVIDVDDDETEPIKKPKYDTAPKNIAIPSVPSRNRNDGYKKMYYKCLDQYKRVQQKYDNLQRKFDEKISHYEEKLEKTNTENREYLIGIEETYKKQLEELESGCENRIKTLSNYVTDLKNNEYANFNSLSKIIFNCITIEEIHKIRRLINTQQIDELLKTHMSTLQNIMLGLTAGIIPICNPQRTVISDEQRQLVSYIQDAAPSNAKRKIKHNRKQFTKLWSIVDDSLRLVCETYNRYGSHDAGD